MSIPFRLICSFNVQRRWLDITNIGAMHYNTSPETYCFVDNSVLLHNKDWRNTATSEMEFVLVKFRKFSDPNRNLNRPGKQRIFLFGCHPNGLYSGLKLWTTHWQSNIYYIISSQSFTQPRDVHGRATATAVVAVRFQPRWTSITQPPCLFLSQRERNFSSLLDYFQLIFNF